jgi:iron complex transport system substrate-binding protein
MTDRIPHSARLLALTALCLSLLGALLLGPSDATSASKKRIVALTPFSANTLVAVGVKPVAIGQMAIGNKGLSPKLRRTRRLALSHPNGPNMEQIAAIDPDVVLTSSEWRKGSKTMRDLAITVRELDATKALDVPARQRTIGYAYGSRAKTNRLVKRTRAEISYATKGSRSKPHPIKQHPRVLMVLGVGRTPYVFINNSWGGSVARAAGARLLGGDLRGSGGFAKVSDEYVIAQDPDVILAVPHGNAKDVPSTADFIRNNPAWSSTSAVRNKRVFVTMDDALLQANVDVGDTIKRLRVAYLKNW